jgi:hypothetical protein
VHALWRWLHVRRDEGAACPLLFRVRGEPPLASSHLSMWLTRLLTDNDMAPYRAKVTGKSMRKGGASAALDTGATRIEVMQMVRWSSDQISTYASRAATPTSAARWSPALPLPAVPSAWSCLPSPPARGRSTWGHAARNGVGPFAYAYTVTSKFPAECRSGRELIGDWARPRSGSRPI